MSFLITSHGRTATKWLAEIMNRSPEWTVLHEPRKDRDNFGPIVTPELINTFMGNYGEVNSVAKRYWLQTNMKKGVILRDPKEVILSYANRPHWEYRLEQKITEINVFERLFWWTQAYKISYWRMTTDLEYLQDVVDSFVTGVNVTEEDLGRKVNRNVNIKFKTWDDLPRQYKELYDNLEWDMI